MILTKIIYVDQKIDFINYFREKNTEKYVAHNLEANKFETNSKLKSLKLANTNVVIPTKGQLKQDKTKNQIDSNITILKKSIKNYSRQTQIQDFEKKVDNNIISSKKENLKTNKLEKDSRTLLKKSNKNASTIEKYSIKSAKPTSQHQVFPSSSSSKFSVTKSNNTIMNNSKITKKSGIDKNSKLKTNYENRDKIQKNNLLNLKNLSLITTKNANYSKNLQFDLIKKKFFYNKKTQNK